jgi:hypothetical protein
MALALALTAAAAQVASAQLGDGDGGIVTASECSVSGGGRLLTATGDEATFGGSASTRRTGFGHQIYSDHGPAVEFRFTSLEIQSLVCIEDGRYAQMTGTGKVETDDAADQTVEFRLEMQDGRDGRTGDGYHLTLSNGYDSGLQPVLAGEVQVHFP